MTGYARLRATLTGFIFIVIWIWILVAPVVAFKARRARHLPAKALAIGSIGLLLVVAFAAVFDISFIRPEADVLTWCAAYGAYCYLAFSPVLENAKIAKHAVRSVALVPIFCGYALGTVGVPGLGLIIADATEPPIQVTRLERGVVCEVNLWGAAMTDSGYIIRASRRYGLFLERTVTKVTVNQSAGDPEMSCADLLNQYAD